QAISSGTAGVICKLLQTVDTSYYGTAKNVRKFQIMAKTGTTPSDCDRWFCAGTPYYVAAVWLGYDIKAELYQDVNPCGKIWFTVFDKIHVGLADKEFPESDNVVEKKYCKNSGKLAGSGCGNTAMGYYKTDDLPEVCNSCSYSSSKSDSEKVSKTAENVSQSIDTAISIINGER
ncbi:MAG: hypothetical protein J5870_03740, partial [Clostridia bacterium]|nr:hypothetical protein [Clostridia bacterium]